MIPDGKASRARFQPGDSNLMFTLFIPSFNRAHSIGKTLASVNESTFRNFEVIIIDDGSTDHTLEIVEYWREKVDFPFSYIFQENSGKMQAHNRALSHARGFLFMTLDAGDLLLPTALELLKLAWEEIPSQDKVNIAGISALCLREDGALSGKKYPERVANNNYLSLVSRNPLSGEKRQAIRTTVMKQYPYPLIPGEKHIRPDLILKRMAHHYQLHFINVPVQVNKREADGITANIRNYRLNNPKSFKLYFLEEITVNKSYYNWRKLYSDHWRYVQYSLHSGIGLKHQFNEVHNMLLWLLSIPEGVLKWVIDRYRMHGR